MRLLPKLGLTLLVAAFPQLLALFWWDAESRHATAVRFLARLLVEAREDATLISRVCSEGSVPLPPGGGHPTRRGGREDAAERLAPPEPPAQAGSLEEDSGPSGGSPEERASRPPGKAEHPRHGAHRGDRFKGGKHKGGRHKGGKSKLDGPPPGFGDLEGLRQPRLEALRAPPDLSTLPTVEGVAGVWNLQRSVWGKEVALLSLLSPADPNCGALVLTGTTVPGFFGAQLPASPLWVAPLLSLCGISLFALYPLARRIQSLEQQVERAAEEGYAHSIVVDGDDELGALARAFDTAARNLRERAEARARAEEALRRYLANVTHDLLIPLTVLKGHLSAMRNESPSLPSLQPAIHEAHYIGALVQNLAAAARLEAAEAPLQLGPVDLCALVDRVAARHRPIARPRGVSLTEGHPEETLWAQADLTLLEAAVSNLAYNAVRHNTRASPQPSPPAPADEEEGAEANVAGGHVAIVLDAQGDHFEIQVIDDGPGIAPEALSRLLARGARGDEARSRSPEGQGLGLDIVLRIVAAHGFQIDFGPAEGGGLRVLIRGPLLSRPPAVSNSTGRAPF